MTDHFIDESGVILAESSGAGLEEFGPVIRLEGIEPPPSTFPGSSWTLPESPADPNPVALAASRLSAFLLEQVAVHGMPTTRDGRPIQFLRIQPLSQDDAIAEFQKATGQPNESPSLEQIRETQLHSLYVRVGMPNGNDFWVYWRSAPGSDRAVDEPAPTEKLAMFREWLSRCDPLARFPKGALYFHQQGPVWKEPSR
jgi:hypothetical protein